MIAFGHTAVGSFAGLYAYSQFGENNLSLGLLSAGTIGVVSHYVTDFIPHGHFFKGTDYAKKVKYAVLFDFLLSVFIFLGAAYLANSGIIKMLYILFGIGGAQLPDIIDGLVYTGMIPRKGIFKMEVEVNEAMHWHGTGKKTLLLGVRDLWQLTVIIISFLSVIYL